MSKHIKYFQHFLKLIPSHMQSQDPNKLALVFYAVNALQCLGHQFEEKEKAEIISWIMDHYHEHNELGGFIGTTTLRLQLYTMSLANTLFALQTLHIMGGSFNKDTTKLLKFVEACQHASGGFASGVDMYLGTANRDSDLRYTYIAVGILHLLGKDISRDAVVSFVMSKSCYAGGFGDDEPHAGYTSCALSTLKLLNYELPISLREKTVDWLMHRQVSNQILIEGDYDEDDHGGWQGRENKFADTCYAFWVLNSLNCLDSLKYANCDATLTYLEEQTQGNFGGWSKTQEDTPDPYHSMMAVAAMGLIRGVFDGVLFIPKSLQ